MCTIYVNTPARLIRSKHPSLYLNECNTWNSYTQLIFLRPTVFDLQLGAAVFLVSNKLVEIAVPKVVENQDELIGEAAQELGKATTKVFDFDGDGQFSLADAKR